MGKFVELSDVASSIPFDNTGTATVADNVQDSILENSGVSYKMIISTATVNIPLYHQMIVIDGIEIEGSLVIEGELCLI
jgi:hypothetical protein